MRQLTIFDILDKIQFRSKDRRYLEEVLDFKLFHRIDLFLHRDLWTITLPIRRMYTWEAIFDRI